MTAAGIDVCKASLDLAVDGQPGVVGFANNRAGITKLVKFQNALAALQLGHYGSAAGHFLDSLWARQTPARAERVTGMIRTGKRP